MKTQNINLLTQNTKMKKTSKHFGVKLFNFNMPAYKGLNNEILCPFADSCIDFCYAQKGFYRFSNTQKTLYAKYLETLEDSFIDKINEAIIKNKVDFLRIHDSADFYNTKYLNKWLEIAKNNKSIYFYAYSKSIPFFKGKNQILPNFEVIYSFGGKKDHFIDINKHVHAKIFDNDEQIKQANYQNCSDFDLYATSVYSDNNKKGLRIH